MGAIVLNGNTSGSTTIQPTDAVTVTLTTPGTSGTIAVSGTSPSFTSITTTSDATIHGLTVGLGGGSVSNNTVLGVSALSTATSPGGASVAIGYQAMQNATDTFGQTVAIGYQAGRAITSGNNNVFVGLQSGLATTIGNDNSAFGLYSLKSNISGSSNTAIGREALQANTASNNTAIGYQAGYNINTGGSNVCIGTYAGTLSPALTTGSNNTYIGYNCGGSANNNTYEIVIGSSVGGYGSNTVTIGSSSGNVHLNYTSTGTWTQTSDQSLKTNIQNDTIGLAFITALQPKTYTWIAQNELPKNHPRYRQENNLDTNLVMHGLIAQEVKAVMDAQGITSFNGWEEGPDGIQGISREMFITPLINAVKELSAELNALKAKVG